MRVIMVAIALVGLAGCSSQSSFTPRPVSVGSGPNALKRAPCAGGCGEVKQKRGLPKYIDGTAVEGTKVSA